MIPKSLSASSVQVYEACPARWKAENFDRAPQPGTVHADLGTACHEALERYVKEDCHFKHASNLDALLDFYSGAYEHLFGDDTSKFDEGIEMLKRWHERQNWTDRTVLSTEQKTSFMLKTSAGEIPFNYIWDRCDLIDGPHNAEGGVVIEVIDYKTLSRPLSPDALRDKVQARCYGLAAQIQFPEATRIWVTFDMLRYDPVGIVFTRDENIATWKYLRRLAERIIDTEPEDAEENLNDQCHWCIRKGVCESLQKHGAAGGVLGVTDHREAAMRKHKLENAKKGLDAAIGDLDDWLLAYAEQEDVLSFDADELVVEITAQKRRVAPDAATVAAIIGPELTTKVGSMTVGAIDKLLKSDEITAAQKAMIRERIGTRFTEPTVKVSTKNPIDD